MFKVKKNDKAFQELVTYAKSVSLPLKDVLLSDAHLDSVSEIFYKNMPMLVKMSMKKDKFKDFYKTHRESFAAQLAL